MINVGARFTCASSWSCASVRSFPLAVDGFTTDAERPSTPQPSHQPRLQYDGELDRICARALPGTVAPCCQTCDTYTPLHPADDGGRGYGVRIRVSWQASSSAQLVRCPHTPPTGDSPDGRVCWLGCHTCVHHCRCEPSSIADATHAPLCGLLCVYYCMCLPTQAKCQM